MIYFIKSYISAQLTFPVMSTWETHYAFKFNNHVELEL